jgi:uncharacterized membrane protein YcjF (UPF0283 family)
MVIAMIHRGIQYTIAATAEPDIWRWQFQIGDSVRTGRTQTRLAELAARRVQSKIDTALRALVSSPARKAAIALDCVRDEPGLDVP